MKPIKGMSSRNLLFIAKGRDEKWVNSAATDLCLIYRDVSLLDKRGELLQLARKKVADDGYVFKKGHSLSKVYGISQHESTPKQPKYSQEMRVNRIK